MTTKSYSTSGIIENSVHAPRNIQAALSFDCSENRQLYLEKLPATLEASFQTQGFCFSRMDDQTVECQLDELRLAFNLIAKIPLLYKTVIHLVRNMHILDSESDQHDVSFSDPRLPFTIFVSLPSSHQPNSSIRIAEAIVHEAMHLQLTLIENFSSLVLEDGKKFFSPWKNEERPPSGVLHALYVFSVIYVSLPLMMPANDQFITRRRTEIESQVHEIENFRLFNGLSSLGQVFRNNLFSYFDEALVVNIGDNPPFA